MKVIPTFEEFINESIYFENELNKFNSVKDKFFIKFNGDEISLRAIFSETANEPMIIFGVGKKTGKKSQVNLKDLIPTQPSVSKELLLQKYEQPKHELPTVGLYNNKLYIIQGHHRLAVEKIKGLEKTFVNLIKVNK
jgi:hypothetical protein